VLRSTFAAYLLTIRQMILEWPNQEAGDWECTIDRRHWHKTLLVKTEPMITSDRCTHMRKHNTVLFEMIVGVITTCHTQYTWDRIILFFLFNRTTLQVFVTYLTGALCVHPLWFYKHQHDSRVRYKLSVACQRRWFQWRFWSVPSIPGYLREEEEHKPAPWRNHIERNHIGLHLENEVAVVKTPTIISNNPVL